MRLLARFLRAQLHVVEVLSAPAFLSPALILFVQPQPSRRYLAASMEGIAAGSWQTPLGIWFFLLTCCLIATLRWTTLISSEEFSEREKRRALAYNMAGWFVLGSSLGFRAWLA